MSFFNPFLYWLLGATLRGSFLTLATIAFQIILNRWLPARWRYALWMPLILVLVAPILPVTSLSLGSGLPAELRAAFDPMPPIVLAPIQNKTSPELNSQAIISELANSNTEKLLFAGWLLGFLTMTGAGLIGYWRSFDLIGRGQVELDAGVAKMISSVCKQISLRPIPRVIASTKVESPAVAGLLQPTLLLPATFSIGFTPGEARLILIHELTHLQRRDLPLNWLLGVLQALHWFNPFLWLAFAQIRAARELACDAQVLSTEAFDCRADYGHALLKLQRITPQPRLSIGLVGIFEKAGMRSRILAIARYHSPHPLSNVLGLTVILILFFFGATRGQTPSPTPAGNKKEKPATNKYDTVADEILQKKYLEFYLEFKDAEHLFLEGDFKSALESYQGCTLKLLKIQDLDPQWQAKLVVQRLADCKSKIRQTQLKVIQTK